MQSIGERLEEARKRKGVTIREAAEATKIRGEYLNSFENNQFGINVPEIYVRGFLRSYCNFLKLNSEKLITDYNATLIGEAKAAKREHREFFGRVELQQPLVSDPSKAGAPRQAAATEEGEEKEPFNLTNYIQNIDKEVAIKIGIIAAAAILLIIVLVWIFGKVTSGPTPSDTPRALDQQPSQQAESETIRLFARGDVRVTVTERQSGQVLLNLHPLVAGQSVEVTKTGAVRIEYTTGENLEVEVRGQRYGTGRTGPGFSNIP